MADPMALLVADAAAQAVEFVGLPEAQLNLAQAVGPPGHRAEVEPTAAGVWRGAASDVRDRPVGEVPAHLRDAHYRGAAKLGHGEGYEYPHDDPGGWVDQQYLPDELLDVDVLRPSDARRRGPTGRALARSAAARPTLDARGGGQWSLMDALDSSPSSCAVLAPGRRCGAVAALRPGAAGRDGARPGSVELHRGGRTGGRGAAARRVGRGRRRSSGSTTCSRRRTKSATGSTPRPRPPTARSRRR